MGSERNIKGTVQPKQVLGVQITPRTSQTDELFYHKLMSEQEEEFVGVLPLWL